MYQQTSLFHLKEKEEKKKKEREGGGKIFK
jgi:hypothetical protein